MADYVDNPKFTQELISFKARLEIDENTPCPEYIGYCILEICRRFAMRPNFFGYSYRDEMVSDAVENCLQYLTNFDPSKSTNAFGYFTQIAFFAFIRRIAREKKQSYIKHKLIQELPMDYFASDEMNDPDISQNFLSYIQSNDSFDFESIEKTMVKKPKNRKTNDTLDEFMI